MNIRSWVWRLTGSLVYAEKLKEVIAGQVTGSSASICLISGMPPRCHFLRRRPYSVVAPLFSDKLVQVFGRPGKRETLTQFHKDMAASIQRMAETVIFIFSKTCTKRPAWIVYALPVVGPEFGGQWKDHQEYRF